MLPLENKIIAITGGAAGMGFATAKHLIICGARVSICDVQEAALAEAEAILQKIPTSAAKPFLFSRVVDVANVAEVDSWIEETIKTFGHLDGAANMAGTGIGVGSTPLLQMNDNDWNLHMAVNLTGVMYCMRAQLRVLTPGGSIVNCSSAAGTVGVPNSSHMVATKHGVIGLTTGVALEVASEGTRINAITPGPIRTAAFQSSGVTEEVVMSRVPMKRVGDPEEVGHLVAFLLGDGSKFITGGVYAIDGGLTI